MTCEPDGWEPIPFFQAVYHGYIAFFGSYSSLTTPPYDDLWPAASAPKDLLALLDREFSRQFLLEHARSFAWGQQPTLANFRPSQFLERATEIDYVLRLAKLRQRALKYLQDGTMLPAPKFEVPSEEVPISRLSIYAGQQGALKGFRKTVPLVVASSWQAADGGVAIALASIADRPLTVKLPLDAVPLNQRRVGRVRWIGEEDVPRISAAGTTELQLALQPLEARVLEWTPVASSPGR